VDILKTSKNVELSAVLVLGYPLKSSNRSTQKQIKGLIIK